MFKPFVFKNNETSREIIVKKAKKISLNDGKSQASFKAGLKMTCLFSLYSKQVPYFPENNSHGLKFALLRGKKIYKCTFYYYIQQ